MVNQEGALFGLLETLPAGTAVSVGVIALIALFFVTSADSGSLVVDMLATSGDPDPPTWSRVLGDHCRERWHRVAGVGRRRTRTETLQTAAIMAALPVSVLMILMCVALWPLLRQEHRERVQSPTVGGGPGSSPRGSPAGSPTMRAEAVSATPARQAGRSRDRSTGPWAISTAGPARVAAVSVSSTVAAHRARPR